MSVIINAQITDAYFGFGDHDVNSGILRFGLTLDLQSGFGWSGCFVDCALDEYDKNLKKRVPIAGGLECLAEIMRVVDVNDWEDLRGKYIRVVDEGTTRRTRIIGNILKEEWVDIDSFLGLNEGGKDDK